MAAEKLTGKAETQKRKSGGKNRKSKKPAVSPFFIGIVIGILVITAWGFFYQFTKLEEIGRYKACLEIERDPYLAFPCTCRPKALNASDGLDPIYSRTEPLCICECKLAENVTETFEIRKAGEGRADLPPQFYQPTFPG